MKKSLLILLSLGFLFISVSSAGATNITIWDKNGTNGIGIGSEDEETEPGMQPGQEWDLEAFILEGSNLFLIGGYDFINGQGGYAAGDIFLDFNGDAQYGDIHNSSISGNQTVTDTFGFDVALDMAWTGVDNGFGTFNAIQLSDSSDTITAYYSQNQGSNPWQYSDGGSLKANEVDLGTNLLFTYMMGQTDQEIAALFGIALTGGLHNVVSLDLSFLGNNFDINNMIIKNTMQCGNDSIVGQTAPVPEPATMVLFGIGLIGLAGIGRREVKK